MWKGINYRDYNYIIYEIDKWYYQNYGIRIYKQFDYIISNEWSYEIMNRVVKYLLQSQYTSNKYMNFTFFRQIESYYKDNNNSNNFNHEIIKIILKYGSIRKCNSFISNTLVLKIRKENQHIINFGAMILVLYALVKDEYFTCSSNNLNRIFKYIDLLPIEIVETILLYNIAYRNKYKIDKKIISTIINFIFSDN